MNAVAILPSRATICLCTLAVALGPHTARAQVPIATRGQFGLDSATAQERIAFREFVRLAREQIVSVADAMPATKYGFAPTIGAFEHVRTFSRQVKHLAATNYMLAAVAIGQPAPIHAGDEMGPDSVITKPQHLAYLNGSFDALERAVDAVGDSRVPVVSSPISPFQGSAATRLALISESLMHAFDHYGQMVVYLRMNGLVPPASRK